MRRSRWLVLELASALAALAAVWIWTSRSDTYYFPALGDVLRTFYDTWIFDRLASDVLPSLRRLFLGLAIGAGAGFVAGIALGRLPRLGRIASPVVEFCRAIPAPAIVPILLLLVGLGERSQITLIAFGTLWPVLLSTVDGVRSVDPTYLDTARSYRIPFWQAMFGITIPAALPQVFAGLKTSLSIGIILMVISEMVGSTNGVGYFILQSQRSFAMQEMWAGIVLLGLLGYALNALFEAVERRILAWYLGSRANPT